MKTIWLVEGGDAYECSHPLQAFAHKHEAEALKARLERHKGLEPTCPELNAPDEEWNQYYVKRGRWERRAPIRGGIFSEYLIYSIPFKE